MMKKLVPALCLVLVLFGCTDEKCRKTPVETAVSVKIIDKSTNHNIFAHPDQVEILKANGSSATYTLVTPDSTVKITLDDENTFRIPFRLKSNSWYDTLYMYYSLTYYYDDACGRVPTFKFDSIYYHHQKVNGNVIMY